MNTLDQALDYLADHATGWKLAGSALNGSTSTVTVPNDANEVCVVLGVGTNMYTNIYPLNCPFKPSRWMLGGYWAASNDWGYGNVNISNNGKTFQRRYYYYSGQNSSSSANMYVYYR